MVMPSNLLIELGNKGVDIEHTLARFMNKEALFEKFLYKFLEDDNFKNYMENLAKKDYKEALINIHTLKGVTANLGMNNLFKISEQIVIDIRAEKYDNLEELSKELEKEYNIVCDVIKNNK